MIQKFYVHINIIIVPEILKLEKHYFGKYRALAVSHNLLTFAHVRPVMDKFISQFFLSGGEELVGRSTLTGYNASSRSCSATASFSAASCEHSYTLFGSGILQVNNQSPYQQPPLPTPLQQIITFFQRNKLNNNHQYNSSNSKKPVPAAALLGQRTA